MAKAKKTVLQAMSDPVNNDEITVSTPQNWKWVRLIQLYKFIDYRGRTPKKTEKGIPLITAKNVRKGYLDYTISEYISEEEYKERQTRGVSHRGDILFTTEAPMGYAAIADLDVFSAGQRVITFQKYENTSWANNRFYYYYILSDWFQGELDKKKTGSTVAGIKAEKLMRFPIPLPPIAEQQRIVDRIESLFAKLDEAKEKAQAVVDGFEDRKAAILHQAFAGDLTVKWRIINKVSIDNWENTVLGKNIQLLSGQDFKPEYYNSENHGLAYITGASNFDGTHVIINRWTPTPSVISKRNDVLLVCKGSGYGKTVIADFEEAHIARQIMAIRVNENLSNMYVYYYLQSRYNYLREQGQGLIPGLSRSVISSMTICIPSLGEQNEIVNLLISMFEKEQQAKEAAKQTLAQIDTMKKAILARAFRGELGTNDPTDESAAELLKRIL